MTPRPTPRPRALAALREAMADGVVYRALDAAPSSDRRPSSAALWSIHERLAVLYSRAVHGGVVVEGSVSDVLLAASHLALAAAQHGYPRPALEALGAQASAVPNARTSDPVTSKRAGDEAHVTPTATNHLGRLLVALLELGNGTSEDAATHAGIPLTAEYAKRVSVLERLGYVRPMTDEVTGAVVTRKGRAGRDRQVYHLTDDGYTYALALRAELVRGE